MVFSSVPLNMTQHKRCGRIRGRSEERARSKPHGQRVFITCGHTTRMCQVICARECTHLHTYTHSRTPILKKTRKDVNTAPKFLV